MKFDTHYFEMEQLKLRDVNVYYSVNPMLIDPSLYPIEFVTTATAQGATKTEVNYSGIVNLVDSDAATSSCNAEEQTDSAVRPETT
jgi:hypothetical protein